MSNIGTSVNAAFTADKLNAAKSYFNITDSWHVHCNCTKIFQSSLSCYNGVDKENCITVIALHKWGIERACIFVLLKPVNITHVLVYHVQLFLDMGGVNDQKRSGWPCVVYTPQVINAVRSIINWNPVRKQKNHSLGNGYCTKNYELHYQTRFGAFKQQTAQCLTVALKEKRKKSRHLLSSDSKERYK